MKRFVCNLIFFILMAGVSNTASASERLIIAGTGDSQIILQKLAVLFQNTHPNTLIIVPDSVGSGGGIKQVIKGEAGLARTARALKKKEKSHALTQIPFALSPVVFTANPNISMVKSITMNNIVNIYNGSIMNWQELGGKDHKIYPVDRETGDSSRQIIDTYLKSVLKNSQGIKSAGKFFYTTGETMEAIVQNPYTLGYLPFSVAREANLHIFSLGPIFPNAKSIMNKTYPLVTTFYLVKPAAPGKLAKAFLLFIKEDTARELMLSSGVFPLKKTK